MKYNVKNIFKKFFLKNVMFNLDYLHKMKWIILFNLKINAAI